MEPRGWLEFLLFLKGHWQSPCVAPMAGKCLPLGLHKETVKYSRQAVTWVVKDSRPGVRVAKPSVNMKCMANNSLSTHVYSTVLCVAQIGFNTLQHEIWVWRSFTRLSHVYKHENALSWTTLRNWFGRKNGCLILGDKWLKQGGPEKMIKCF